GAPAGAERRGQSERMLFSRLPVWEEADERPPPLSISVDAGAATARLAALTGRGSGGGQGRRARTAAAASVFAPRRSRDGPNMLLAEAGTGIGKTLAYFAPASLWAEA